MTDYQQLTGEAYIDLHIHLDGAITVPIARRLAEIQHMELPKSDRELFHLLSVPAGCENLNEFLSRFDLPISLLQTEESICEAVFLVQEMIQKQHIIYAEIRFAPQSFMQRGLSQRQVIEAALKGLGRSQLCCNLILCCMRGPGREEANMETVRLAHEYLVKHNGIVALDLAGAEGLFPTSDYRSLFRAADAMGVPFTLHAGEAAGAESVRCAVEMGARRIGHGVRAAEDDSVVELLLRTAVPLEMCPTSNRQTKAVSDMAGYPIRRFLEKGLKVTLNTDDMAISDTTLSGEFSYVQQTFGITGKQRRTMLLNAADAAFTDEETHAWLRKYFSDNTKEE